VCILHISSFAAIHPTKQKRRCQISESAPLLVLFDVEVIISLLFPDYHRKNLLPTGKFLGISLSVSFNTFL